jgi:hypothetical protein
MSDFLSEIRQPFENPAAFLAQAQRHLARPAPSKEQVEASVERAKERHEQAAKMAMLFHGSPPPPPPAPRPLPPPEPLAEVKNTVAAERVVYLVNAISDAGICVSREELEKLSDTSIILGESFGGHSRIAI